MDAISRLRDMQQDYREALARDGEGLRSYHEKDIAALDLAIAALEREHAERWRSVEEEAPPVGLPVLVTVRREDYADKLRTCEAILLPGVSYDEELDEDVPTDETSWCRDSFNDEECEELEGTVTHWRPLPAPAKEAPRG